MSTGMSTIEEISKAYQLFTDTNNLILLQCTSSYPTNDEDVNLKSIITLREKFDVNVGYSGHERGTSISAASVMFGASVIERHFTLDRTMKGPDHAASLEPEGMKLLIDKCKRIFNSIGSGEKNVLPCEFENRKKFRGY
jgi:N-acetylneuraminate synthase